LEDHRERQKLAVADQVSRVFGIIMVVLYIVLGTTIILKAHLMSNIPENTARMFGVVLILYGLFRAYKVYLRYFKAE
jgi:uncharacterized protein YjeT (DUF2065 family)